MCITSDFIAAPEYFLIKFEFSSEQQPLSSATCRGYRGRNRDEIRNDSLRDDSHTTSDVGYWSSIRN